MKQSDHEKYLQRKQLQTNSSIFSWLFCCSAAPSLSNDAHSNRKPNPINKRPLKHRNTHTELLGKIDIKENFRAEQMGAWSDRKDIESQTTKPMKFSLHVEENRFKQHAIETDIMRKNCKIRFSYAQPIGPTPLLKQQLLSNESSLKPVLSAMETKESFRTQTIDAPAQKSVINQMANLQQQQQKIRKSASSDETFSPRSFARKDSLQSPKVKRQKKAQSNRFSLRMRQVESIRQPEEDSDHESVVIDDDNDGLFSLLVPIREVDKESRLQCSREDERE